MANVRTVEVDMRGGKDAPVHPPSYSSAMAPPPTYEETIQKRIQRAREENPNNLNFARKVCAIFFATVGFSIILALSLALPISMIVVGSINVHDCPAEPRIPALLIALGCIWCLSVLCSMIKKRLSGEEEEEEEDNEKVKICSVGTILSWLNTILFIVGSVYVYKIAYPITDHTAKNYCDYNLYYFAFWLFTTFYIITGLFTLCCCCFMVYAVVSSSEDE